MIAFPIENRKGAFQFGGQFLLDPNEFNGMAAIGFTQNTFNTSLSSVGGNPQSIAGGFMAIDSIRLTNFKANHRNTSALALAWGWRLSYHTFVTNSTGQTNILRECVGLGATATAPRNYLSTKSLG